MQPLTFQLVADAANPHALARFWADALGWTLEDNEAFIQSVIDAGYATSDDVVEFEGRMFWRTLAAIRHPDDPYHPERGSGLGRRMLFQHVDEPKQVKNRWHIDVNVGRDRIDAEVNRLRGLGATPLYQVDEPGAFHTTMADPEGNEFCVQ
jgi:Glyoxalase-like domain